jgi:hypothetical protein
MTGKRIDKPTRPHRDKGTLLALLALPSCRLVSLSADPAPSPPAVESTILPPSAVLEAPP